MFGSGQQIGLVSAKEIEHRAKERGVRQPAAQVVRSHSGEREKPLGAGIVSENPAQRAKRQGGRVRFGWG